MSVLSPADIECFTCDGFVGLPEAFSAEEAGLMRAAVWELLASRGIDRDDPSTWRVEGPDHLQDLKRDPVFSAVGGERTLAAIDELLGPGCWRRPRDWGALFVSFPTSRPWTVASGPWHLDHAYAESHMPLRELKVQAMYSDVAPRAGGMHVLAGSHRLVENFLEAHPPTPDARPGRIRKALMCSHPYLQELEAPSEVDRDAPTRIARYMERDTEVHGAPVRVVELTATAGDVILLHPLVLHARPTNAGRAPRFLLNKDLYRNGGD